MVACVLEKEGVPTLLSACSSCLRSPKASTKAHYMLLQNLDLAASAFKMGNLHELNLDDVALRTATNADRIHQRTTEWPVGIFCSDECAIREDHLTSLTKATILVQNYLFMTRTGFQNHS